jgi:cytochrome c biogenesis protein CcmG/thiol:disulfide interchange protein DsbE
MKRTGPILVLVAAAAVLPACRAAPRGEAGKVEAAAAPVSFADMDKVRAELAALKGRPVFVNFWATWCGPCKAEIPGFVEMQEKYRDQLTIIGYSVDDDAVKARAFAQEYKMNYPILLGLGREDVQDAFGPIWGIPSSFIISKDGKVCKKHIGIAPRNVFENEIKALL